LRVTVQARQWLGDAALKHALKGFFGSCGFGLTGRRSSSARCKFA
jgi:hypothetical protein